MITTTETSTDLAGSDTNQATVQHRIIYLAPDCTDSAVKKRAKAFLGLGHKLTVFSFRRDRYNVGTECAWHNIELGKSKERRLLSRLLMCLRVLWIIFRHRDLWRRASVIYARNLDLALLALVGRILTRCRAPLVYEVLDIHPLLVRNDIWGAVGRWLERRVLKRCRLLVVSSPAFVTNYFKERQQFRGETFLLENKWAPEGVFEGNRKLSYHLTDEETIWTIGWFGNLRCRQSLDILTEVADALPSRVRIFMRGCASLLGEESLMKSCEHRANMTFGGEYDAPDELPEIYSQVHFNWCADFSDGVNSLWLIPNRIYEGGYFGIPAIAIDNTQTGRIATERQLGMTLLDPYSNSLIEMLLNMNRTNYEQLRGKVESQPVSNFVDNGDLARLLRIITKTT